MGWASTDLTKFVQEENEELTHLSAGYVKSMIDKYRNSIPPAELLLTVQNNAVVSRNATMKISNGLEELAELNKLYDLQMERINIDVTSEKKVGKLFKETGREIFYAMKILKQSSDLKMDLGIAKRQLGEVSINGQAAVQIGDRYNDGIGKVMADPDRRRKVLGMVETLMALTAKASIDVAEIVRNAGEFVGDDVIDVESKDSTDFVEEIKTERSE